MCTSWFLDSSFIYYHFDYLLSLFNLFKCIISCLLSIQNSLLAILNLRIDLNLTGKEVKPRTKVSCKADEGYVIHLSQVYRLHCWSLPFLVIILTIFIWGVRSHGWFVPFLLLGCTGGNKERKWECSCLSKLMTRNECLELCQLRSTLRLRVTWYLRVILSYRTVQRLLVSSYVVTSCRFQCLNILYHMTSGFQFSQIYLK